MGRILEWSSVIYLKPILVGPHLDPRFTLHHQQPRADKLDARQRSLCLNDSAYCEALERRVKDARRFAAYLAGMPSYVRLGPPCDRCSGFRRRTRDRSCYICHLNRGRENFELMKAAIAPKAKRRLDSHLDLLARQKAERQGECEERTFGVVSLRRWPTGRLEVIFPDGYVEPDLSKQDGRHVHRLMGELPELREGLIWAGWF